MNRLTTLVSYALCFSLWFFTGCSSTSDPKPIDCNNSDLAITIVTDNPPATCSSNNGVIEVEATGGNEPYTFSKDGTTFTSSSTFAGLGGGNYLIHVKDKNGCEKTVAAELVIPGGNSLTASVSITPDTDCTGNNGTIEVVASGGSPPYKYKIGNEDYLDNGTFGSRAPGVYSISVKDNLNCVFTVNATTITQGNTGITYDGEIKALFEAECKGSTCHDNNSNRVNLFSYTAAEQKASDIKSRTQSGNMPKNGSLTSDQKALIACWVDGGAPQ